MIVSHNVPCIYFIESLLLFVCSAYFLSILKTKIFLSLKTKSWKRISVWDLLQFLGVFRSDLHRLVFDSEYSLTFFILLVSTVDNDGANVDLVLFIVKDDIAEDILNSLSDLFDAIFDEAFVLLCKY